MATKEYYRQYYKKNRERIIANHKRFANRHPGYFTKYVIAWQARNPDRVKSYLIKAQPARRQINLESKFRKRFGGNRENVIKRDGEKCLLCGLTRSKHKKKYGRDIVVDHIDGNGRGSKHPNNNINNLRTLCLVCNLKVAREKTLSTNINNNAGTR